MIVYVRAEQLEVDDAGEAFITGEVRTKLGRGPWSYWIPFRSTAWAVRCELPSLHAQVFGQELTLTEALR